MIPRIIDPSTPSDGEKHLFKRLELDENSSNWTVLHSLNIAHHKTQIMGEVDFLVAIPDVCIFAIEVKTHRFIKHENGLWFLGKDSKGETRSPFKQLNDAVFSLRDYLYSKDVSLATIPIFPLVIFTHTDLINDSIEWNEKELCGAREYRSIPISNLLLNRAKSHIKHLKEIKSDSWFRQVKGKPSNKNIDRLINLLRPNIEPRLYTGTQQLAIDDDITYYTKEQFIALDSMADNNQVIFKGPAGVGKTVLAIEAAIRAANNGNRVLLLCKNRLLLQKLTSQINYKNIHVETITSLLESFVDGAFIASSDRNSDEYWNYSLPQEAYVKIIDSMGEKSLYDFVVIDEGQDIIINENWMDCIELLLVNGLMNGKWYLFGDFEYQDIYSIYKRRPLFENIQKRVGNIATFNLKVNCRNLRDVSTLNFYLSKLDVPYSKYLRNSKPLSDSKYYFYKDEKDQILKLEEHINLLTKAGFKLSDIVILSKVSETKSVAHKFRNRINGKPYGFYKDTLQYTSIHKFKGLEAPIIIMTNFDEISTDAAKKLLYVGASRAIESVIYLFDIKVKNYLLKH